MSQAVIERVEVPELVKRPPAPVKHLFCQCQRDCPGGQRFAWCGIELSGKGTTFPAQLMDLCILCQGIRQDGTPCKFCGDA